MRNVVLLILVFIGFLLGSINSVTGQTYTEEPLWLNGIPNNPIKYDRENMRTSDVRASSLSQKNRVFSYVSEPVYTIVKPDKPNGVGIVICPGGGFRDVWFDREGTDFALFLAKYGITSMVLKYRTFNSGNIASNIPFDDYAYHVYADAKQAVYMLRRKSKELGLDTLKIGIGGFSAGGSLALGVSLEFGDDKIPDYAGYLKNEALPNFACLIYPGIHPKFIDAVETKNAIPPIFMVNGNEDNVTPAKNCIDLFLALKQKNVKAEMHIYAKGNHGFDSGIDRGYGISLWHDSFIAWLKDMGFMN